MSLTPIWDQVVLPDRALCVAYKPSGELSRRQIAQGRVRTKVVVLSAPRFDLLPSVLERQEPMGVETLVPERAVERLDERVVGRTTRAREVERDPLLVGPPVKSSTAELTAVIRPYTFGDAMTGRELLQDGDDPLTLDALVGVDRQAFPRVLIDDRKGPEAPTVKECIRNEIHRPAIVLVGHIGSLQTMC